VYVFALPFASSFTEGYFGGHIDFFCDPPAFPHLGPGTPGRLTAPGANGCLRIAERSDLFRNRGRKYYHFCSCDIIFMADQFGFFSRRCAGCLRHRAIDQSGTGYVMRAHSCCARRTPKSVGSFDLSLRGYLLRSRILF